MLRQAPASVAENWVHEGPNDPAADQLLLAEALSERDRYRTNSEGWMDWDAFKAELKAAEAAGEYQIEISPLLASRSELCRPMCAPGASAH